MKSKMIKKMFRLSMLGFIYLWVLMAYEPVKAQEGPPDEEALKLKLASEYYRQLGWGLNRAIFRDFATSPLFYQGFGLDLQLAWHKISEERERITDLSLGFHSMTARIPSSSFIAAATGSFLGQLNFRYLQLWKLKRLSDAKHNVKIGGLMQTTQNVRINANLQNNSLGLERLSNLMFSVQVRRDLSRKADKDWKIWFIKGKLKAKQRSLRWQFNTGILNFNYRPDYAYSSQGEIIGLETNPLSLILSNYKWSWNGWRLSSEFEYLRYLANGNARAWAYVWEAAHAPGRHESFQMASHRLRYSYYFHTKTK